MNLMNSITATPFLKIYFIFQAEVSVLSKL